MLKNVDVKYVLLFISIVIIAICAYVYDSSLIAAVELFLSSKWTPILTGMLSFSASILVKIKHKQLSFSKGMAFSQFKVPLEEIWSFISNPTTLVCSLSLAKGLFAQLRNKETVFVGFSTLEIVFICIVVIYLLFDGITDFIHNCKLVFSKGSTIVGIPEPIEESD